MAIALRRPYVDELLGTLIAEYMDEEKVAHRYAFLMSSLGCHATSLVAMPGGLQRLSDQTSDYWNMTATEIAETLTLMPYYVASCSPRVARNVLAAMTHYSGRIRNRGGLGFGRFSTLETLRYCRHCIRGDIQSGCRPHFRRVHQLPGVAVCTKHKALLICSDLRVSTFHVDGSSHIGSAFTGGDEVAIDLAKPSRMEAILGVAKMSEGVLMHAMASEFFDMRRSYKLHLEAMGYTYRGGNCRLDELSADIVAYFGGSFLRWLGLFRAGQEARDWLVPLLCQGQAVAPTVAHVLLQQFISAGGPNIRRPADKFAIECVRDPPDHEACAFGGDVARRSETDGNARCIRGTNRTVHLGGQVAMVEQIRKSANCRRDFTFKQTEIRRGTQELASKRDISAMNERRSCNGDSSTRGHQMASRTSFEVQRGRQEWLEAVERFGSLTLARSVARKTYRALLKYDRAWLDSHRTNFSCSSSQRIDWALRDSAYVLILRDTAAAIRSESPPRWVSEISILMVAGVPRGIRNQLGKLPKCTELLRKVVETRQQFRERKRLAEIEVVRSSEVQLSIEGEERRDGNCPVSS